MYFLGIDIGSLSCDAVIIDEANRVVAQAVVPTGARNREAIARVRDEVYRRSGLAQEQIVAVVSTGYGREQVDDRTGAVTEISCHARGIQSVLPGTQVLVDIGGQDSKAIRLDGRGRVLDFAMNDKCAAGTGRFLEAMARALEVDLEDLEKLERGAQGDLTLSSMCTVFAESEVVSLIAQGTAVEEIARGLHRAIANRVQSLVKRVARDVARLQVAMSGGVARNAGVVHALERALACTIRVPPDPDTIGALGAALFAKDKST